MHCLVTYGMTAPDPTQGAAISQKILTEVSKYPNYGVFTMSFIVRLDGEAQWQALNGALTTIATTSAPVVINFVMTPLMPGGKYVGYLPQNAWNEINRLSSS